MGKKSTRIKSSERKKRTRRNKSKSSSSSFYSSSPRRDSLSVSSRSPVNRIKKPSKPRKSMSNESDKTQKNYPVENLESENNLNSKETQNINLNVNYNNDIEIPAEPNSANGLYKEEKEFDACNAIEENNGADNNLNNEDLNNLNHLNNNLENAKANENKKDDLKINEEDKDNKAKKGKKDKHRRKERERSRDRDHSRSRSRSRDKDSKRKSKKEKKIKKDSKRKRSYSSNTSEESEYSNADKRKRKNKKEKKESDSIDELKEKIHKKFEEKDNGDKSKQEGEIDINLNEEEKKEKEEKKAEEETSLVLKADLEKQKEIQALAIRNKLLGYVDENAQALEVYKHYKQVDINSIPNIQKKVIIFNLPPNVNDDEIKEYFYTLLLTLNPDSSKNTNPIVSIEKCDEGFYFIFELATKDDIEILMNMDQTDWRGYKIRIQKPRRFFTDYNDTQGSNAKKRENKKNQSLAMESDNKLYMGGIPLTAKESEVRELVESFGQLKLFNLVKDPNNEELNRGFCFFEYLDEKVTERALKGLNNIDMADRKLRVQRATINNKSFQLLQQLKANPIQVNTQPGKSNFSDHNPTIQPHMQVDVPIYAALPSRVIQLINMINPEDVMDDLEYREIVEDIRNECMQYGTVLNVEIPRPDKNTSIAGPAVGKIFIKFSTLQSAKKARFKLSGKKYNRRTCVSSFYPENYFDVREFNFHER